MPELPEVETTIRGLKKTILGLTIKDIWTDLSTKDRRQSDTIANPEYFKIFKKEVLEKKIISVERRAKNILINISGSLSVSPRTTDFFQKSSQKHFSSRLSQVDEPRMSDFSAEKYATAGKVVSRKTFERSLLKTILVHMKMTGHLLYGKYKFTSPPAPLLNKERGLGRGSVWIPVEPKSPLSDPYNRFIHVVFTLSNGRHLVFSDARKFGKITLLDPEGKSTSYGASTKSSYLAHLGPEPLEKTFTLEKLKERLNKKLNGKIKTVLMDQSVVAGIGNIYSDEILWRAGIHPERKVSTLLRQGFGGQEIKEKEFKLLFKAIKETLKKGVDFGGDSMSDYRNIYGLPGKFQLHHEAYRRTGQKCRRKTCRGVIERKVINGRSAHFCPAHQK